MKYPSYSDQPLTRAHAPVQGRKAEDQRSCLRLDFDFRCVYCLASEAEVGPLARYGGFEIEHFMPSAKFRKRRHTYENLLWACAECNRAKGGAWPSDELLRTGRRLVDPSKEGLGRHLVVGPDDDIEPRTAAGEYMVELLNLRSRLHRLRRSKRREKLRRASMIRTLIEQWQEVNRSGGAALPGPGVSQEELNVLHSRLAKMEEQIAGPLPHDAPSLCGACVPPLGRIDRSQPLSTWP